MKMKRKDRNKIRKKDLIQLIRHAWVHTAYADCGFMQMTTEQKKLYCKIVGDTFENRLECHAKGIKG